MNRVRVWPVSGVIALLVTVCLLRVSVHAQYSGGTDTPDDPYQITTAQDLILLGQTPNDYDKHFVLTADIDLDPNLPGRRVFDMAVIGPDTDLTETYYQGVPFTGVFDGNDHVISRLQIAGESHVGMFGQVGSGGEISNLGIPALVFRGHHTI